MFVAGFRPRDCRAWEMLNALFRLAFAHKSGAEAAPAMRYK